MGHWLGWREMRPVEIENLGDVRQFVEWWVARFVETNP